LLDAFRTLKRGGYQPLRLRRGFNGKGWAQLDAFMRLPLALERRGLVKVLPNPGDGRSRVLRLTPKGKQLLEKAMPVWESAHAELDERLKGESESLRQALMELM
jgi:hypothetical protein